MLKLFELAYNEVGYLEKKSKKYLDDKKANAGSGNYTKYWRDIAPSYQGQAWCDVFVSYIFIKRFGRAEANKHLCGGVDSYYTPASANCYKTAGKWSNEPSLGAQIFFKDDVRICHTGIVVGYSDSEVFTIEGNTSSGSEVIPNGGGVFSKSYQRSNPRIAGYGLTDLEVKQNVGTIYVDADKYVNTVDEGANIFKVRCKYGDSHSIPPCADNYTSCDRGGFAWPCYQLGWTDQPAGGVTVLNIEAYAKKWKWTKITDQSKLQKGDVVLMKKVGESKPSAAWHVFVLTAYNHSTKKCSKYDFGSEDRIRACGYFTNVPFNEWPGSKEFYCAFRSPRKTVIPSYTLKISEFRKGYTGKSVKLVQKILRGLSYHGKDKKLVHMTGKADDNTMYALANFQKKHGITGESGFCGPKTYRELFERVVTKVK